MEIVRILSVFILLQEIMWRPVTSYQYDKGYLACHANYLINEPSSRASSQEGENSSKIRGKNPSLCRLLHFPSQLLKNSTVWIMSLLNMIFSASSWQFNLLCLGEENLLFSINTKWGDEIASCIISIKMLLPSFPTSYSQHSKAQLGEPSTRK